VPDVPLVGRQGELAELLRLLHDAVAGHGALAVVSGEAGLGKTRLVRELERHAQEQGVVVLSGAAVEDGPAYRPIAQALLPVLRSQSADRPLALRPYRAALGRLFPAWAVEAGDAPDRVDTDPALVLGEGTRRAVVRRPGALRGGRRRRHQRRPPVDRHRVERPRLGGSPPVGALPR
jgi:hypothetical protein